MRIRIVNDDDKLVGEFVTLVEHSAPPPVVLYEARRALERAIGELVSAEVNWTEAYVTTETVLRKRRETTEAINWLERAVRAEALASQPKVKLRDCRGIVEAINEACTCGGNGPGEGCPACEVYHGIADMEFVKG